MEEQQPKRPQFKVAGSAAIKHLNVRKEGPDDEKILAVDIKMEIKGIDKALCWYFDDALAMKRCGEIWLSMAKDVYVEEGRQMKVITDNGDTDSVTLMQPTIDQETGEVKMANDLGAAKE